MRQQTLTLYAAVHLVITSTTFVQADELPQRHERHQGTSAPAVEPIEAERRESPGDLRVSPDGSRRSAKQPIPRIVQSDLGNDWELTVDPEQSKVELSLPFRWVVFRNKRTGNFLSIASHPEFAKNRGIEDLADTSIEIFPDGRAVWTQSTGKATTNVIAVNARIVRTRSLKEEVLEYCFISEAPGRENLMAHGRTWVGPEGVVFVQHTSAKPITSVFVEQTIKSFIHHQRNRAAPTAPR